MSAAVEVPDYQSLDSLAGRIREAHAEVEAGMQATVAAAARCGELLAEAKRVIGHGGWATWLEANFPATQQTANLYMRMHRHRGQIETAASIWEARKLLAAPRVAHNTGETEWYTPGQYVEMAREVMGGIDVDPASNPTAQETVRAERYFTAEDDGLEQEWRGRVWMNPPYRQPDIARFAEKLVEEVGAGNVEQAIVLASNGTDAAWWHALAEEAVAICFVKGRIAFNSPHAKKDSPTQGSAFFYFGADAHRFAQVFRPLGLVLRRMPSVVDAEVAA